MADIYSSIYGRCLPFNARIVELPQDLAQVEGIWVTSVPRTLVEIAGISPTWRIRRLYEEADRIHLVEKEAMREVLDRCRNRKGTAILRELSGSYKAPTPRTESHAEYRFFRLGGKRARASRRERQGRLAGIASTASAPTASTRNPRRCSTRWRRLWGSVGRIWADRHTSAGL